MERFQLTGVGKTGIRHQKLKALMDVLPGSLRHLRLQGFILNTTSTGRFPGAQDNKEEFLDDLYI